MQLGNVIFWAFMWVLSIAAGVVTAWSYGNLSPKHRDKPLLQRGLTPGAWKAVFAVYGVVMLGVMALAASRS
jgi:Mn2+/Fe2+ NRAMP family transporter